MNCGLKHFGNDVMQLSYLHASICANFSFNFLKNVVRDQRWLAPPLFIVNFSPSFGEFTATLRHILPIHNVTTNSNNLFVNFLWTFNFALRNFDWALPIQTHLTQIKPVLPLSKENASQVKNQSQQQRCHNKHKKFLYRPTRDETLLSDHT